MDYKSLLAQEYENRKRRNPAYSMRAYAKSLGVAAATLSGVLSDERQHLSKRSVLKIAGRLSLSPVQHDKFLTSALGEEIAAPYFKQREPRCANLEVDRFRLISDWYHFAMLSLGHVKGSQWDAQWIAAKLGISLQECQKAMERLERLDMVEVLENGYRQKTASALLVESPIPEKAIRDHHWQNLQMAHRSLLQDPIEERRFEAITLAIDSSKLDDAKKLIDKFLDDLFSLYEEASEKDRVYTVALQLFPVSKKGFA